MTSFKLKRQRNVSVFKYRKIEIVWSSRFDHWNSLFLAKIVLQYLAVIEGNLFRQVGSGKDPDFRSVVSCLRFSFTFCNVNRCNCMMSWISIWIRISMKLPD